MRSRVVRESSTIFFRSEIPADCAISGPTYRSTFEKCVVLHYAIGRCLLRDHFLPETVLAVRQSFLRQRPLSSDLPSLQNPADGVQHLGQNLVIAEINMREHFVHLQKLQGNLSAVLSDSTVSQAERVQPEVLLKYTRQLA
jgi:hypothetical protein